MGFGIQDVDESENDDEQSQQDYGDFQSGEISPVYREINPIL